MKFTFDYKETLIRRVIIEADCLSDAINRIESQIEKGEIILGLDDFVGGEIRMPLAENFLPQLQICDKDVENKENLDIIIDFW